MKIRKMNDEGTDICYRLKSGKETEKDAIMHFTLTKALKNCFSAQALPFPIQIDTKQLEKEVHIPPKSEGQVVTPFTFRNVHCDLKIVQRQDDPTMFDYSYLFDKYVGTIATSFLTSGS